MKARVMYRNGSLVTLINAKSHFDGQDTLSLSAGTCGMVVQIRTGPQYVVDFGAYGQWNCAHEELNGDDIQGLTMDSEGRERQDPRRNPIDLLMGEIERASAPSREPDRNEQRERNQTTEIQEEEAMPVIDFEADMAARVALLEKEIQ